MSGSESESELESELESARLLLVGAPKVVVLTGAGISTDSGIPDFRGPDGVWTRDPEAERLATIDVYLASEEVRGQAWASRLSNPAWVAAPNAGHDCLARFDRTGRLALLVTQNVDGLHVLAGNDPARVAEVHGSIRGAMCVSCTWRGPMVEVLDRVRSGEPDPACSACGGVLKSTTVFFGEYLDQQLLDAAFEAAGSADVLLAVGSTLQVFPIASMVEVASGAGVPVVIVNGGPTGMDHLATHVIRGPISEVLPALLDEIH